MRFRIDKKDFPLFLAFAGILVMGLGAGVAFSGTLFRSFMPILSSHITILVVSSLSYTLLGAGALMVTVGVILGWLAMLKRLFGRD